MRKSENYQETGRKTIFILMEVIAPLKDTENSSIFTPNSIIEKKVAATSTMKKRCCKVHIFWSALEREKHE